MIPNKSVFNKIIGDSDLELRFAQYLEQCQDIISYVKNYFSVQFKIDYKNDHGDISNYYPDFIVKKSEKEFYIIEGAMGLYDGLDATEIASTAHVAKILDMPVLLVVDARGVSRSLAAVVKGFSEFDTVNIQGIILNNTGSERHNRRKRRTNRAQYPGKLHAYASGSSFFC
ncbi:type III restriction protein res subunit [groundwater metagenome]